MTATILDQKQDPQTENSQQLQNNPKASSKQEAKSQSLKINSPDTDDLLDAFRKELPAIETDITNILKKQKSINDQITTLDSKMAGDILAAAKAKGLGEFDSIGDLLTSLSKNQNAILLPTIEIYNGKVEWDLELLKIKKKTLSKSDMEGYLGKLKDLAGLKAPKSGEIFFHDEVLYDKNPKGGVTANYGTATKVGNSPTIMLINPNAWADDKNLQTEPKTKLKAVIANELVPRAYNEKYPSLAKNPTKPLIKIEGLAVSYRHIVELASDYASLQQGEEVVDVFGNMIKTAPSYTLSNQIATIVTNDFLLKDKKLLAEVRELMKEAEKKGVDKGAYAMETMLANHPEKHDDFRKLLVDVMEHSITSYKEILDIVVDIDKANSTDGDK